MNIDALLLPKALLMYHPDSVSENSAKLTWSPTDANDFREYKIYKHTTSGTKHRVMLRYKICFR